MQSTLWVEMTAACLPAFDPRGALGSRPLALLIAQIWEGKRTGMLHVSTQNVARWIFFEQGFPCAVHDPKSPDFLGAVLLELGYIDEKAYNESLMRMVEQKRRQGEILLEAGRISHEQLARALLVQLNKKLSRLFTLHEGEYRFEENARPPDGMDLQSIQPCSLILNSIKHHYSPEEVERALSPLSDKAFKLSARFDREVCADFGMASEESRDVLLLKEPCTLERFVQQVQCTPVEAKILLVALNYCGLLELCPGEAVQPPKPRSSPLAEQPAEPKAGAEKPKEGDESEKAIQKKFNLVLKEDLFEVLGVSRDVTEVAVKKAYFSLAKVFHPDHLSPSCNPETRRKAEAIFGRVSEAYSVLSNPEKRAEYLRSLTNGCAGGPPGTDPNEAKVQFHKAQVYLKRRDITNALSCLRSAMDLDPKNGDYKAYRLWVQSGIEERAEKSDKDIQHHISQLKADLQKIVKDSPLSFFGWKFLAEIHKRQNLPDEQEQCLSKAHRIRPEDVDVNREMRLLAMRKSKRK